MGIAVWRVTIKQNKKSFLGMLVFAPKNMRDYRRSSEHVVTRHGSTGRSTVPYWCTIDVWTHTGPYGVPTGPPGPRWDPTGPQRTAGGTVGPHLIGASPVWAARSSYWRSRGSGEATGMPRLLQQAAMRCHASPQAEEFGLAHFRFC